MKNFVQPGDVLTVAAPYTVASGDGLQVGQIFGVAGIAAANGVDVEAQLVGVFDLTALTTDVAAVGVRLYWDNTNKRLTVTASTHLQVGVATKAKINGDTTARVRLHGAQGVV